MLRLIRNVLLGALIYVYLIPFTHTNEILTPYTNKVLAIVNTYCTKDQYSNPLHEYIYFAKLPPEEVGECGYGYNKFIIKIDRKFWFKANEDERHEVIFHEMYHCLFKKDHVDNPYNYMYYRMTNLTKEVIIQQFTDDVKRICKGDTNGR